MDPDLKSATGRDQTVTYGWLAAVGAPLIGIV